MGKDSDFSEIINKTILFDDKSVFLQSLAQSELWDLTLSFLMWIRKSFLWMRTSLPG